LPVFQSGRAFLFKGNGWAVPRVPALEASSDKSNDAKRPR
jgi:hypothetical protein